MKCSQVQEQWHALLDRTVPEAARGDLEGHLRECRLCECEYQALVAAEGMLRRHALVRRAAPPGLIDRVMMRLQDRPARLIVREALRLAVAAAVLLGILTLAMDRVSYEPMVETMNSKFQDTRTYVTRELPRAITTGFSSVWEGRHE